MDYISQLKELNITFNGISECEAEQIMNNEISFYKLMEYSCVFERYKSTSKKGCFIGVDFSHLYYLAKIDFELSCIVMRMCLKTEQTIKTTFFNDVTNFTDTKAFMDAYYETDEQYLRNVYTVENFESMKCKHGIESITDLSFAQFLDVMQVGTFERILNFFYKEAMPVHSDRAELFVSQIPCLRRIRNIVAHNNSILGQLTVKRECKNFELLAFLGKNGIKNKTLKTNMSKGVIADLCGLFYLYFNTVSLHDELLKELMELDDKYCRKYLGLFSNNSMLQSLYYFMVSVTEILKKLQKNC